MAATATVAAFSLLIGTAYNSSGEELFTKILKRYDNVAACRLAINDPAVELAVINQIQKTQEVHLYEMRCTYAPGEPDLDVRKEL